MAASIDIIPAELRIKRKGSSLAVALIYGCVCVDARL